MDLKFKVPFYTLETLNNLHLITETPRWDFITTGTISRCGYHVFRGRYELDGGVLDLGSFLRLAVGPADGVVHKLLGNCGPDQRERERQRDIES